MEESIEKENASPDPFVEERPTPTVEPTVEAVKENIDRLSDNVLITLEGSMKNLDYMTTKTQNIRETLLDKFLPQVLNLDMTVRADTDPDQYASQTRFIEQTRQLLNDIDSSAKNHLTMKMKQSDMEAQQQSQVNIVELLSKIQINTASWNKNDGSAVVPSEAELASALEKRGTELGCKVLDTELTVGESQLPKPEDDETTSEQN